jgi:Ca2+-binding RTX toxin-like protein
VGGAGNDLINGGAGADIMHGGADNDTFVFASGEANGDTVLDFTGNGAAAGDSFQFTGFGTAAQGATFTQVGVTNTWQIHSGLDAHNEIITLDNGASVHASDYVFV